MEKEWKKNGNRLLKRMGKEGEKRGKEWKKKEKEEENMETERDRGRKEGKI